MCLHSYESCNRGLRTCQALVTQQLSAPAILTTAQGDFACKSNKMSRLMNCELRLRMRCIRHENLHAGLASYLTDWLSTCLSALGCACRSQQAECCAHRFITVLWEFCLICAQQIFKLECVLPTLAMAISTLVSAISNRWLRTAHIRNWFGQEQIRAQHR